MKIKHTIVLLLLVFTFFGCMALGGKKADVANDDDIFTLPPMKDHFTGKFMIGNIFNPPDVSSSEVINTALTRHYSVLTAENHMKPNQLSAGKGSYNFTTADRMVDAALASGFKVVGHTLLWHSQIPTWQQNIDNSTALNDMKQYVTDVVGHFRGKIYSWDVLNEAFPDGGYSSSSDWKKVMRSNNPWYKALGSDFVYEGFLAARLADPGAILYYNDYNTNDWSRAKMIHDMVKEVNEQYQKAYPGETRLLIEGIGMQSHHNINVRANAIKNTLFLFKSLGVKISISELDILIVPYSEFASFGHGTGKQNSITEDRRTNGLREQARLYGEYFKVFLEFSDIIERVSFWGVTDDRSWRSAGLPLIFYAGGSPKDAYYSVIGSIE
jgi:endo-1,4-beta-xylanase